MSASKVSPDLVADELDQGVEVELGSPAPGRPVDGRRARQRAGASRSIRRAFSRATLRLAARVVEEPLVGLAEGMLAVEVLERDDAARLAADDERDARTDRLGLARPDAAARAASALAGSSSTSGAAARSR